MPIVVVSTNGIAVTESANGKGTPVQPAASGRGVAVVIVTSGGIPVVGSGNAPQ